MSKDTTKLQASAISNKGDIDPGQIIKAAMDNPALMHNRQAKLIVHMLGNPAEFSEQWSRMVIVAEGSAKTDHLDKAIIKLWPEYERKLDAFDALSEDETKEKYNPTTLKLERDKQRNAITAARQLMRRCVVSLFHLHSVDAQSVKVRTDGAIEYRAMQEHPNEKDANGKPVMVEQTEIVSARALESAGNKSVDTRIKGKTKGDSDNVPSRQAFRNALTAATRFVQSIPAKDWESLGDDTVELVDTLLVAVVKRKYEHNRTINGLDVLEGLDECKAMQGIVVEYPGKKPRKVLSAAEAEKVKAKVA